MDIENLDVKYAIEFLNSVGYSWDGSVVGNNEKPKTIMLGVKLDNTYASLGISNC